MFWNSKKKALEDWLIMGCGFICENDRVYENIVTGYSPQIDFGSEEFIAGKFLFRSFAANGAIAGAGLQQKLNESTFDELQMILKTVLIKGNKALPESNIFKRMGKDPRFQVSEIPEPKSLFGGKGAEFMDKNFKAFTEYCALDESSSETLVDLYLEAFSHPIKDLNKEEIALQANVNFAHLRRVVMDQV